MKVHHWSRTCALGIVSLLATSAISQDVQVDTPQVQIEVDRQRVQVNRDRDRPRGVDGEEMRDRQIARWLITDQKNIVDLAGFGLQRTKTPEVRELAETIIRDHRRLTNQLASHFGKGADTAPDRRDRTRRTDDDRDDARRPLENLADRVEEGVERITDRAERAVNNAREAVRRELNDDDRPARGLAWVNIHRDIADKAAEIAQRDLEKYQGYEFDGAFVGMMTAAHLQQEATLQVLSEHASSDMSELLDAALATIQAHRQRAEQVMGTIKR
ncbi:MAG: hypothetical protein R3C05_14875 [Pirellulaceae bacterium]